MGHSNRSKYNRGPAANPKPAEVILARERAGLTQDEAAKKIYGTATAWHAWEAGERPMHPGLFELFLIKTSQKLDDVRIVPPPKRSERVTPECRKDQSA